MPRNRTITQCEALYAGPSPATGAHFHSGSASQYSGYSGTNTGNNLVKQLYRVQSANYGFNIPRRDVNQFGELASIERLILDPPTVSLTFDYLVNGLYNERILGFTISTGTNVSCISGILNKTQDERNYFIKTVSEGNDANGDTSVNSKIIAIGNGFISNYTASASVGDFPRASVTVEGLNMNFDIDPFAPGQTSGTMNIPAVNPSNGTPITAWQYQLPKGQSSTGEFISALRPGDITFSMGYAEGGVNLTDAKIQSYSIGFDLTRENLLKLGSKFAFAKELAFPLSTTLSITADVGDLDTGKLTEMLNNNNSFTTTVSIAHPSDSTKKIVTYTLASGNLDSQSFSSSIGSNKSVTLTFQTPIGGPQQLGKGVFLSGYN